MNNIFYKYFIKVYKNRSKRLLYLKIKKFYIGVDKRFF